MTNFIQKKLIIAHAARGLIAVEGEFGTLSEIAVALKLGRPVASLGSWPDIPGVMSMESPAQAVTAVLESIEPATR